MPLDGKVCVVIGASSSGGIGAAIAERLKADGAVVTVAARREAAVSKVSESLGCDGAVCDIGDEQSLENLFEQVTAEHGGLDVAVNAAGVGHYATIDDLDPETVMPVVQTQLVGALLFIKHAARAMGDREGSIILLSSLTASNPAAGQSVYAGTKAAVDHAVKIAAVEYGPRGIRVNSVAPGLVRTSMTEKMFASPRFEKAFAAETALGRITRREDVAAAVAWLASDEAFVTGEVLPVSGGAPLRRMPTAEEIMGRGRDHEQD